MRCITVPTGYYQQFHADDSLEVPAEGFGGWQKTDLELDLDHTAIVVMHAWDCGTKEEYPGWYRTVEYLPRANAICRDIFPGLLSAVRNAGMKVFHVGIRGDYLEKYPGWKRTNSMRETWYTEPTIQREESADKLWDFWSKHVVPGEDNIQDVNCGFQHLDFPPEARPLDDEEIAVNADQLFTLCQEYGITHLIYMGFAINGCLLVSPGGIADMVRRGILCSAIRQAVTAIENKESARHEIGKEMGLWFVSIISGFVYDMDDFTAALKQLPGSSGK